MNSTARICALLLYVLASGTSGFLSAAERPNIVFIYTDDQAPTAAGFAGNPQLKTPHIDRIAREGATLVNSFVTTPVCSPSRAGLMTSRYSSELGILDWINPRSESELGLDPDLVTWPELLQKTGYRTALVGKWHLGTQDRFHPTTMGYDEFFGFRSGGNRPQNPTLEKNGETREFPGFTADVLTDGAIEFLESTTEDPFLLSLHFRAPHAAWLPVAESDWAPYREMDPILPDPDWPGLNVERVKKMTREYYASCASVDRNVGRVLAALDRLKLTTRTIVIFTSDHGYHLGHNALWYKGNAQWQLKKLPEQVWDGIAPKQRPNLFDQALRVPTAIRWPGVIRPGSTIQETITNLDWFPTLVSMAGCNLPDDVKIHGRDFTPLLTDSEVENWDNDLYAEYSMRHGATTDMRAIRTPRWKLMVDYGNKGRRELYDLKSDPTEKRNLAGNRAPEIAAVEARLNGRLIKHLRSIGDDALIGDAIGGQR